MKAIRFFALAAALCVAVSCSGGAAPAPSLSCKACKASIKATDPCAKCGTTCSCGNCAKCCACPAK